MVYLLATVVAINWLEMAFLEKRMSTNAVLILQAQQASRAGVEWAMENMYKTLLACSDKEELPLRAMTGTGPIHLTTGTEGSAFFILHPGIELANRQNESCIYSFTSLGRAGRASYELTIQVKFDFVEHFHLVNGLRVFNYREYIGNGEIIYCSSPQSI